jgi:hypothetical protein
MKHVFLLWYEHGGEQHDDDSVLIGVYSSEVNAAAARERLKDKPGFSERYEAFTIDRYEVNQDHWTKGFIRD